MKNCLACDAEIKGVVRSNKKFCVTCRTERDELSRKKYVKQHPERRLESVKVYREKNKELCIKRTRTSVLKKHEEYKKKNLKFYRDKYFGGLRDAVVERDKNKCRLCGSVDVLVVHHVDTNKTNNTLLNLITLCHSCHSTWHNIHRYHKEKRSRMIDELHELNLELTSQI